MSGSFPYDILEDAKQLAGFKGWTEEVYRDLQAFQKGNLSEAGFREKYAHKVAILILDMTGFTEASIEKGSIFSFLRIYDVQKVCAPVFAKFGAIHVRTFADDFTATFTDPGAALDAAFEIHARVRAFNESELSGKSRAETCIGLGYGMVYRIGPDFAMGKEMNETSKLGEDTAKGFEILATPQFRDAVAGRPDIAIKSRTDPDLPFKFYEIHQVE